MLLAAACTCAFTLGIVIFYIPYKKWRVNIIYLSYLIKFNILGITSLIEDKRESKYNKIDLLSMPEKIAIVTGGSRGIGATIVKKLLQCDMEVIIACRIITAGEKLILQIRESGITSGRAKVYKLNNSSLNSVREFAEQIKKDYDKIHILINNAGVMFPPHNETEDGFEEQWAVNHLSHFLLTSLLLPLLKVGGSSKDCSRIVNVTSSAHKLGINNFKGTYHKDEYIIYETYAQSKLAQVIFTIALQKLLVEKSLNIQAYSVHPGIVNTNLFQYTHFSNMKWFTKQMFKTTEKGAIPIIYAAISKNIEAKNTLYITNCKESDVHPIALDSKIQKQIFALSLKQAKLNDFFQYIH